MNRKGFLILGFSSFILVAGVVLIFLCPSIHKHSVQIEQPKPIYGKESGYTITAYCPCKICNEQWAGLLCTGEKMQFYLDKGIDIVAVDPTVIPLGSIVIWNNTAYLALDRGSLIKGKRLDILVRTHKQTLDFGIKKNQTVEIIK